MRHVASGLLILSLSAALFAQQKEVRVVKPYTPTLSSAQKIELLPSMQEEVELEIPVITYKLHPKRYPSEFRLEPIKAARMVKMPLERLYKSELSLGMGNYMTPLAELRINQLRSRKGTFGVHVKHHSMTGKVKLENDLKAAAGFNENLLEVYGSRFMKKKVFDYSLGTSYNTYIHYGVDPALDTVLERKDAKHAFFTTEARLGLASTHADSFHFNYNAELDYHYFTHEFDQGEHAAGLSFDFNKKLRVIDIAGEAGVSYIGHPASWDTVVGDLSTFWLNPEVGKGNAEWRFTAGFNFYGDISSGVFTPHIYPSATFRFHIVEEVIVPYFGVDGFLETHSYRSTVEDNPYVAPGLGMKPTNHKLIGYLGLKGRFSEAVAYNLKASYSIIDDDYFYVNDASNPLMNQFMLVYDDVTLAKLHGELTLRPTEDWKVFLQGNYYNYVTMVQEDHPWNKPKIDLSLQARYNMAEKIIVNAGLFMIGSRYYQEYDALIEDKLPTTFDANLGVEYRYSKLLSFWARFNNIAAQKYYLYNNYPSYRFRLMLGLTYAL